ncbi:Probable transmembrane protein [Bacteroides ovatus]|nr:Probable transmembrane protein [Bacteroides ovatus]
MVALALLLSWPYHISLLTMNILVTSVFIFVIVFDMLFPDKGVKIK